MGVLSLIAESSMATSPMVSTNWKYYNTSVSQSVQLPSEFSELLLDVYFAEGTQNQHYEFLLCRQQLSSTPRYFRSGYFVDVSSGSNITGINVSLSTATLNTFLFDGNNKLSSSKIDVYYR